MIGSEDEWKIICTMKGSEVERQRSRVVCRRATRSDGEGNVEKNKPGRDTVASEDEVRPENLLPTFTLTRTLTHSFTHLLIHIKSDTHS